MDSIAGGGGLITLPALLAAGLPPHLALGTNKGQAVFGAVTSAVSFWRRGALHRDRAAFSFGGAFVGSAAGAALLLTVRPEPLKPVVLGLLVVAAGLLAFRRDVKAEPKAPHHPRLALLALVFGLGVYDGFFGPGVGSLLILGFSLIFGDALTRASGNAKVANLASNVAAVLVFGSRGTILWQTALVMAVTNAAGAAVGSRLAIKRGDGFVRVVVLAVVCAVVLKLTFDLRH